MDAPPPSPARTAPAPPGDGAPGPGGLGARLRRRFAGDRSRTLAVMTSGLMTKGLTVLTLPLYTRVMSPSEYGVVGYGTSFLLMTAMLATLSLPNAAQRFGVEADAPEERRRLLSTLMGAVAAMAGIVGLALALAAPLLAPATLRGVGDLRQVFLLLGAALFVRAPATILVAFSLVRRRHLAVALAEGSEELVKHVVLITLALTGHLSATTYFAGLLTGAVVVVSLLAWSAREDLAWRWDTGLLRRALGYTLPFVLHSAAYNGIHYLDRLLLAPLVSAADLGRYHLGYSLAFTPFAVLMTALRAWQPLSIIGFQRGEPEVYRRMTDAVAEGGVLVALAVTVGLPRLYPYLFGHEYVPVRGLLEVLVAAEMLYLVYTASSTPLIFYKRHRVMPLITGASLLVNLVGIFVFVPRMGVLGAGVATTCAFATMGLTTAVAARRRTGESIRARTAALLVAGSALVLALGWFSGPALYALALVVGLVVALRLRRTVNAFFQSSRRAA